MQLPKRDREPQHDHPARDAYCDVDRWRADGAKKKPAEAGLAGRGGDSRRRGNNLHQMPEKGQDKDHPRGSDR